MMVGVNGAGKTTTLGKLAAKHKAAGRSVMLAAGDTFAPRGRAVKDLGRACTGAGGGTGHRSRQCFGHF